MVQGEKVDKLTRIKALTEEFDRQRGALGLTAVLYAGIVLILVLVGKRTGVIVFDLMPLAVTITIISVLLVPIALLFASVRSCFRTMLYQLEGSITLYGLSGVGPVYLLKEDNGDWYDFPEMHTVGVLKDLLRKKSVKSVALGEVTGFIVGLDVSLDPDLAEKYDYVTVRGTWRVDTDRLMSMDPDQWSKEFVTDLWMFERSGGLRSNLIPATVRETMQVVLPSRLKGLSGKVLSILSAPVLEEPSFKYFLEERYLIVALEPIMLEPAWSIDSTMAELSA